MSKSILNQLVEGYDKMGYMDFKHTYIKVEGIHRNKDFYYEKFGQYMNKVREKQ